MLKIFNDLEPFFEDVYREISVREYARMKSISPPNASSRLKDYAKERVLVMRRERNLLLFKANREIHSFKDLAVAYWRNKLSILFGKIQEDILYNKIILFGSIAKVENTLTSDLDLYIEISRKDINLESIEKSIKRSIQLHFKDALKNKNLKENIEKGVQIR